MKENKIISLEQIDDVLENISESYKFILKTHLLIEEALYSSVSIKFKNSEFFDETNISFNQLLNIAKAFYYEEKDSSVWDSLKALNIIRNKLAHRLKIGNIDNDLQKLFCITPIPNNFTLEHSEAMNCLNHMAGFNIAFASSLKFK